MREKKTIESNDLILNYIYVYAMRDATMRGASPFTKGTKAKKKEMENLDDFPKIHQALKLFINSVLSNKIRNYKDYSKRLVDLSRIICCEINSYYKGEAHFTFGNAQKLINMVMKRLYTVCYNDHDKRDSFKYCHCPMDGQLIQAVGFKKKILICTTLVIVSLFTMFL